MATQTSTLIQVHPSCANRLPRGAAGSAPTEQNVNVIEVPLTQGYTTFVDEEDWEKVCEIVGSNRKWHVTRGQHGNLYARCTVKRNGVKRQYKLHRLILDAPAGMEVDHRDGDGLNNRRSNLRLATVAQNHRNRRKTYGSSRFLGVSATKHGTWKSQIKAEGRVKHLGTFKNEVDAARAYDAAAVMYHGEWAAPNFPELLDA